MGRQALLRSTFPSLNCALTLPLRTHISRCAGWRVAFEKGSIRYALLDIVNRPRRATESFNTMPTLSADIVQLARIISCTKRRTDAYDLKSNSRGGHLL